MATDAAGELRLLEQGQRLAHLRRVAAASETQPHCGPALWSQRAAGRCQGRRPAGGPRGAGLSRRPRGARSRTPESLRPHGDLCSIRTCSRRVAPCAMSWSAAVWSLRDGHHAAEAKSRAPIGVPWRDCLTSRSALPLPGARRAPWQHDGTPPSSRVGDRLGLGARFLRSRGEGQPPARSPSITRARSRASTLARRRRLWPCDSVPAASFVGARIDGRSDAMDVRKLTN